MIQKICKNCNKKVLKIKTEVARTKNSFCSRSCANTYNNKRIRRHFKDGGGSYRERARRELTINRCNNKSCPISKAKIEMPNYMFDVDHIKGKKAGHELDNLQLLCVWCHCEKTRKKVL